MDESEKSFLQILEDGLAKLPEEQRATAFRPCAENCVKNTVLPFLRQRFDVCEGKLDLFFSSRFDNEYSFQKVIEKGQAYEFGYPQCFCPLINNGLKLTPIHCECSRQSILYILGELFPNKKLNVEIIDTVLGGAGQCKFKIEVK